ncbi:PH domain-containing protein [Shewanella sedimentimangrovi]|uniref:GRAM domain-containing protein n=1 Tax=Shewanella sedimentimangrovi TaxID=2814293 RepID=A0ABX7QW07_9GAMM|nr:GRAM domain-containing protein [Shewanella sedimentimangrovi]QSX35672.1 hypothetical protein JYB85_09730 [Shewanella sedimentimangrovi]
MATEYIRSTHAIVHKGMARADGRLTLTEEALCFEPLNKGFGLGPYRLPLGDIIKVETYSLPPFIPEGIKVSLSDGSYRRFVMMDAQGWARLLQETLGA